VRKTVQLKGKAELAKAEEPKEGLSYIVAGSEEVKTSVQGFSGIRVNLDPVDAKEKKRLEEEHKEVAAMLWMREVAGTKSKLGAFLDAFTQHFGDEDEALNTENWIGKKIRIVSWKPRAREVAVLD